MRQPPRILLVNQHYYPDVAATGQYLADLAEHLAGEGYSVEVLCASGRYEEGRLLAPERETRRAVRIRRVATTPFARKTKAGRLLNYAGFFLQVVTLLLFGPRFDRVIFLTTPPLLALAGLPAGLLRGMPYGIWSMDLHPEAEVAVGMLESGSLLHRILARLARWTYSRSDFVVALGPYMKVRLEAAGAPPERIPVIPIWNTDGEVRPIPRAENPLADAMDLAGRFVVVYSGNAGLVHRFDEVLEVMRRLRDDPDFVFLFAGNGPQRKRIEAFAAEHGLKHFRYLDYFHRSELGTWFALADVHLLTLQPEAAGIAVPSKQTGAMAAGRPVVMVGPLASEPAEIILRYGSGFVVDPQVEGNRASDRLLEVLCMLKEDPSLRERMGAAGRRAFLEGFQRGTLCNRWVQVLQGTLGEVRTGGLQTETRPVGRAQTRTVGYQKV